MKSFLAKTGVLILSVAIICVVLEVSFTAYDWIKDGRYVSASQKVAAEKNVYVEKLAGQGAYNETLFPHPYLAFVHHSMPPKGLPNLNSIGLFGHEFPLRKEEGTFTVLLTGGSVAAQFAGLQIENNLLEKELNAYYTNDKIKKFVVLNGGDGAWHQPQQFILFSLYAPALDAVITLDGFNEHRSTDGTRPTRLEYPASNFFASASSHFGNYLETLALWADGRLKRLQNEVWLFRNSQFAYFVLSRIRRKARDLAQKDEDKINPEIWKTLRQMFATPADWNEGDRKRLALDSYKAYIRMMYAISRSFGIRPLFLIQPVPAIGKFLTEEEKKVVGDLSYEGIYADMTRELLSLRVEGIPVYSLLDIFESEEGTIYKDVIHINSRGNKLLRDEIIRLLEKEWGLSRS